MSLRYALAVAVVLLAVILWIVLGTGDGPDAPDREPGADPVSVGDEPPVPDEVPEAVPAPEFERGPGSILVTVRRDGEPAAARVFVRPLRYTLLNTADCLLPPYNDEPPLAELETDARGQVRFVGLPIANWEVTARAADGATAWARTFCRKDRPATQARLDLLYGPAELRGRAVHADGRPFRGIAFASLDSQDILPQVEIDETGRFVLTGLPEGEIRVVLTEVGRFRYSFGRVKVPAVGEKVFVVNDVLKEFRGRVVVENTTEPVAGARISYSGELEEEGRAGTPHDGPARHFMAVTTSGSDGAFTYRLPSRQGRFMVRADGHPVEQITKPEIDGATGEMIVRLKRRGTVVARVIRREGGTPVAGVRVLGLIPHGTATGVTDADGRAEGQAGPGKAMLWVHGNGWVSAAIPGMTSRGVNPLSLDVAGGEQKEITIEVVPTARARGTLTNAAGEPVSGYGIAATAPRDWRGFRSFQHCALTGPDGTFEMADIIPGIPHVFRAERTDHPPAESEPLTAEAGGGIEVTLVLPEARHLQVLVTDADTGDPIPEVALNLRQGRYRVPGTKTDASGRAWVGPFGPGAVQLSFSHRDYRSTYSRNAVDIAEPDAEYHLRLTRLYAVSGRIVPVPGATFPGGMLTMHPVGSLPGGLGMVGGNTVRPEGEFRMGGVSKGRYDLILCDDTWAGAKVLGRWTVDVPSEGRELPWDPNYEDDSPPPVVIRVVGPDDRPAKKGGLRLWIGTEPWSRFAWVRDGKSVFDPVPLGTKLNLEVLDVNDADGRPLGGTVVGPVEYAGKEILVRLPPSRGLTGRVEDPDGKPVAGVYLHLQRVLGDELAARGDSSFALPRTQSAKDGTFAFAGLGKGRYRLLMDLPPAFGFVSPPVIESGGTDVLVRLVHAQTVTLTVTDPDGRPLPKAVATVTIPGVPRRNRTGRGDVEGRIAIPGLAPNERYALEVVAPAGSKDYVTVTRDGWRPADEQIVLMVGAAVSGTVTGKTGPVRRARAWWKDARGEWRMVQADRDGRFRVVAPTDGPVVLRAAAWKTARREDAGPEVTVSPGTTGVKLSVE